MTDDHVATTVVASFLAGLNASADGSAIRDLSALAPALELWRAVLQGERRGDPRAVEDVVNAATTRAVG